MMRIFKRIIFAFSILLSVGLCLGFSACDKPHTHAYTWEVTEQASCTAEGKRVGTCSCGEKVTETIAKTAHSFGEWEVDIAATCTEDGESKRQCSVCGYEESKVIEATGHEYGDFMADWTEFAFGFETQLVTHTKRCAKCSDEITEPCELQFRHKDNSCTEDGFNSAECLACKKYVEVKIERTGHDFNGEYLTELGMSELGPTYHHYKLCNRCQQPSELQECHFTEESEKETPATCLSAERKYYKCNDCNYEKMETVGNPLGHEYITFNYVDGSEWQHESTCSRGDCNEKLTEPCNVSTVTELPECTKDGKKTHSCSKCKHNVEETLAQTGHKYDSSSYKVKTEGQNGAHTVTCLVCKKVVEDDVACTFQSSVVLPTCTDGGYTKHNCEFCTNSYVDTPTLANGHTYGDWQITDTEHSHTCIVPNCGHVESSAHVENLTHHTDENCVDPETSQYTCTECQHIRTVYGDAALGHNWKEWVSDEFRHNTQCLRCQAPHPNNGEHDHATNICASCGYDELEYRYDEDKQAYYVARDTKVIQYGIAKVVIPDTYNGHDVVGIDKQAFWHISRCSIKEIELSKKLKYIGEYAFNNLDISSLVIPSTVEEIGDYAFTNCSTLSNIVFEGNGNNIKVLGVKAFSLTSYVRNFSGTILYIGHHLIKVNPNYAGETKIIESIHKTEPVHNVFTIQDGTLSIAENAFDGCSKLKILEMPTSIESIGTDAFVGCTGIELVLFGGDYKAWLGIKFGNDKSSPLHINPNTAFHLVTEETVIKIKDGTTTIPAGTFAHDSSITSVIIPESVTSIGAYAFYNCTGLKTITINGKIREIGVDAFKDSGYYAEAENWEGGALYLKGKDDSKFLIAVKEDAEGFTATGELTLNENTYSIAEEVFKDFSGINKIVINAKLEYIGMNAFKGSGLKQADFNGHGGSWLAFTNPEISTSIGRVIKASELTDPYKCASYLTSSHTGRWSKYNIAV